MTDKEKIDLYERLNWAHDWGFFLTQKFNTKKRFGLEGCDSLIPGMKVMMDTAIELGAHDFIIGMPHRGRLSVLATVVRKPLEVIFAEFGDVLPSPEETDPHKHKDAGDVKYHLGTSYSRKRKLKDGREVDVTATLLANPSHLEAVNPVVMGRARA